MKYFNNVAISLLWKKLEAYLFIFKNLFLSLQIAVIRTGIEKAELKSPEKYLEAIYMYIQRN